MTNYTRGVRYEKKTIAWLTGLGYRALDVRGSHGAVDIIGTSLFGVVVVQVKSGRKRSRPELEAARQGLREWPVPKDNGARWLVTWSKYAREPEVEVVE